MFLRLVEELLVGSSCYEGRYFSARCWVTASQKQRLPKACKVSIFVNRTSVAIAQLIEYTPPLFPHRGVGVRGGRTSV